MSKEEEVVKDQLNPAAIAGKKISYTRSQSEDHKSPEEM